MKIRVFEAFAGYGSQALALERLKRHFDTFDYEIVGISEIDNHAITAYNALHPNVTNYGDISKIDWEQVPDFDLFTYSSPCQDFSNSGLQKGGEEGSGTRSSLLWECRRAIIAKRPKYLLLENVAALVQSKFIGLFNKWQAELESYGYTNFAQVLNARDYGVPQNRERIFLVSIRNDGEFSQYYFPEPFTLTTRLKDVLEPMVDSKYYLSDRLINYLSVDNGGYKAMQPSTPPHDGVASCLTARMWKMGRSDNYIQDDERDIRSIKEQRQERQRSETEPQPLGELFAHTDR